MPMRSSFKRVTGLGAAGEGVGHWWAQRVSALALIPLTIWFVASVAALAGADYFAIHQWLASPIASGLLILLIATVFYHAALSLRVVIEDYVHGEAMKIAALLGVNALAIVLGLAGVLSVLSILFKG
ncbi:MAG: succinate dehydrogenase, hydrophobic membrane anchor protein [Kiloniellaceae bacterium]